MKEYKIIVKVAGGLETVQVTTDSHLAANVLLDAFLEEYPAKLTERDSSEPDKEIILYDNLNK